ncbi:MAG: (2Fe-2S)-binding protein, partial [Gemmatimonadales bacterium]
EIAALAAMGSERFPPRLRRRRAALHETAAAMEQAFAPRDDLRRVATSSTVVCRCEDVSLGAIRADWSSRQTKLYTRAGMGACQGRVCGTALEFLFGWPADSVRLPAQPALLSTIRADGPGRVEAPRHQGAF